MYVRNYRIEKWYGINYEEDFRMNTNGAVFSKKKKTDYEESAWNVTLINTDREIVACRRANFLFRNLKINYRVNQFVTSSQKYYINFEMHSCF